MNKDDFKAGWVCRVIYILIVLECRVVADTNFLSIQEDLFHHLFHNYSFLIRPSYNLNDSVDVDFHISVTQLIEVEEKSQVITSSIWVYQTWNAPNLSWRPDNYGGLKEVIVPVNKIWVPDTSLVNSANNDFSSYPLVHLPHLTLTLTNDGTATMVTPMILKTPCQMDILYFPVDEQQCYFEFGMWSHTDSQIRLHKTMDNITLESYIPNVQWDIVSSRINEVTKQYLGETDTFTHIIVTIDIKRKPLYYIVNLLFPCIIISILTIVVFCLPMTSPDKINLSVSLLLTIYIFNLLVADLLPPSSLHMPLLTVYLMFNVLLIGFSVALTVFLNHVLDKVNEACTPVPKWAKRLLFGCVAKVLFVKSSHREDKVRDTNSNHNNSPDNCESVNKIYINQAFKDDGEVFTLSNRSAKQVNVSLHYVVTNGSSTLKRRHAKNGIRCTDRRSNGNKVLKRLDSIALSANRMLQLLLPKKQPENQVKDDWITLATVLDRICLIIFTATTIVGSVIILPQIM